MGIARIQTPSTLREATVEHLRNEIITGNLKPGELLKEVELAAQLGLSPTPIREALVQLAGQGLVEIEPNRLKRVAPLNLPTMRELVAVQRVLWPWKAQLSIRVAYGQTQLERGQAWFEYSMFFRERFRRPLSVVFGEVATHNHFVLDRGGKVFNRTAPVIKLPASATARK